jgi:hypothetical protein
LSKISDNIKDENGNDSNSKDIEDGAVNGLKNVD